MTNMMSEVHPARSGTALAPAGVVGGAAGLVFVATVIAQNAIRGLSGPAQNASPTAVTHFYATHRVSTLALAAMFPLGAAGLAAFVGTLGSRLADHRWRAPALAGLFGAAGIFGTYTMMIATDIALAGYVQRGRTDPAVVSALWITHNCVFGVLLVSIAVALAGLSAAASASGMVAPLWKPLGTLGALALAITGAATPALIDGSPIIGLGLLGFLTWIAFVATAATKLLRSASVSDPSPGGLAVSDRTAAGAAEGSRSR